VTRRAIGKDHQTGDAAAVLRGQLQYGTPEDGEDASYTLEFRFTRGSTV
jgi:hypothetical protein